MFVVESWSSTINTFLCILATLTQSRVTDYNIVNLLSLCPPPPPPPPLTLNFISNLWLLSTRFLSSPLSLSPTLRNYKIRGIFLIFYKSLTAPEVKAMFSNLFKRTINMTDLWYHMTQWHYDFIKIQSYIPWSYYAIKNWHSLSRLI